MITSLIPALRLPSGSFYSFTLDDKKTPFLAADNVDFSSLSGKGVLFSYSVAARSSRLIYHRFLSLCDLYHPARSAS
jgi:hypothetical protein